MNELFPEEKKTEEEDEMNIYSSKDNFVNLYEDLRTQALNNVGRNTQHGLGLSLFIQRGMVVWMKSWGVYAPVIELDQLDTEQLCPLSLHNEVVTILSNMVLCHQKGVFHA